MIEKLADSSGNVIGFKCIGNITASDYRDNGAGSQSLGGKGR